jgi:hypothetical protein
VKTREIARSLGLERYLRVCDVNRPIELRLSDRRQPARMRGRGQRNPTTAPLQRDRGSSSGSSTTDSPLIRVCPRDDRNEELRWAAIHRDVRDALGDVHVLAQPEHLVFRRSAPVYRSHSFQDVNIALSWCSWSCVLVRPAGRAPTRPSHNWSDPVLGAHAARPGPLPTNHLGSEP